MEDDFIVINKKTGEEIHLKEERIKELTSKFIEECGRQAVLHNDFGMNAKVVNMLIDVKKAWWPSTNKNINLNVTAFDDQLKEWMKARQEMKQVQSEVVYDIK